MIEQMTFSQKFRKIILKNRNYKAVILPDNGFKIASFVYLPRNFELFFQPPALKNSKYEDVYKKASVGDDFSIYDTSGCDDCIPTIDPCYVIGVKNRLNDHGDVWSVKWNVLEEKEDAVSASVRLSSMPLRLTRKVILTNFGMRLQYRLLNEGDVKCPWMWTLHDLARYETDAVLKLSHPFKIFNAQNDDIWNFDIRDMKEVPENGTYKFYYKAPVGKGTASILYPSQKMRYTLIFDNERFPYFGVWITTGGFKGEKNIAMEPSNGFYDSLERAIRNNKCEWLEPGEKTEWSVEILLTPTN